MTTADMTGVLLGVAFGVAGGVASGVASGVVSGVAGRVGWGIGVRGRATNERCLRADKSYLECDWGYVSESDPVVVGLVHTWRVGFVLGCVGVGGW